MLRRFSNKRNNESKENKEHRQLLSKFLEFITSSIWSIPISSFIEQQSIVFDRQQMETAVYERIHKEYSMLIDTLIECFCDDVGTTLQSLTEAIKFLDQHKLNLKQRIALEPLAAAQNYNVFVPMMMRKNIELQLQALQMIEFMCGLIPEVLQIEEGETLRNMNELTPEETERYVLISVLRQTKEEFLLNQKKTPNISSTQFNFISNDGDEQRKRLENEIKNEEQFLRIALNEDPKTKSDADCKAGSSEAPLSLAALIISKIDKNGLNEVFDSNSSEKYTEDRPKSAKKTIETSSDIGSKSLKNAKDELVEMKGSQNSETFSDNFQQISNEDESQPKSQNTLDEHPKSSKKLDEVEDPQKSQNIPEERPKTSKKSYDVGGSQDLEKTKSERPKSSRSGTKSISNIDEVGGAQKSQKTPDERPKSSKKHYEVGSLSQESDKTSKNRPKSSKKLTHNEIGEADDQEKTTSERPKSSKKSMTSRSSSSSKTRSSFSSDVSSKQETVDDQNKSKNVSKRDGSLSRERRASAKSDRGKQKKPPGPIRAPQFPDKQPDTYESSGEWQGPRRMNLDDVHSQLVDRDRPDTRDILARADYLRQQRDRLLILKREERIKHMNEMSKNSSERPKTAKAVRGILQQKEADTIRKEINDKLKTEILNLE